MSLTSKKRRKKTRQTSKMALQASALLTITIFALSLCGEATHLRAKTSEPKMEEQSDQSMPQSSSERSQRFRRNHERDFAPKLIHQPHSERVQALKPHTVECPIESQPESEISWFKDGRLLQSEPLHLEQTGSELMFFQINEQDSGDYHCQASNYLGTVSSGQFRLHVQSTQQDARIRIEPQRAFVAPGQSVEFACRLPTASASVALDSAQISWRRNGQRLVSLVWLLDNASQAEPRGNERANEAKFLAKQVQRNEFVLLLRRANFDQDNNSTFSCAYEGDTSLLGSPQTQETSSAKESAELSLARESSAALLLVVSQPEEPVKIDVNMAPPVDELSGKQLLNQSQFLPAPPINATNSLDQRDNPNQIPRRQLVSLSETLHDLYEIAKPTLIIFAILCLVALLVLVNFIALRRRALSTSRYMKHHQFTAQPGGSNCSSAIVSSSSSSSSSSNSGGSAASAGLMGDPMLSSLISRTLSAPSAAATAFVAGKKYKHYRDQMRKVAQAQTCGAHSKEFTPTGDFLDAANYFCALGDGDAATGGYYQQQQQQQAQLPNLYNQSLAAREQARSLLQASEHMRSLSNLMPSAKHPNEQLRQQFNLNGSHLNLPLSFNFDREPQPQLRLDASQLASSANQWPKQQHLRATATPRQQSNLESHQLVGCQPAASSPSSSTAKRDSSDKTVQQLVSSSNHHYSTIETDELAAQEELRYEELEGQRNVPKRASMSSAFSTTSTSSSSAKLHGGGARSSGRTSTFMNGCDNNKMQQEAQQLKRAARSQPNQYHDQLSPYAVSSICNTRNMPPPLSSEAMRALNEQFDINQLVQMDDSTQEQYHSTLPFQPPPPPPTSGPPEMDLKQSRGQQKRKKSP